MPDHSVQPRLLVTAGPTHEPIDAVRFLGNRSSGRLGVALSTAAATRGWPVTLLLGPTCLEPPVHSPVTVRRFRTAEDLRRLLAETWPDHDLLIMAAAVADYRPAAGVANGKIERQAGGLTLDLEPTPDLVAEAAASARPDQRVVGFALEDPERLAERARAKLQRKGLHAIVANPLETMDAASITARVLFADGRDVAAPPDLEKAAFAAWLLDLLET